MLALAPDAPSQRAAQSLASGRVWPLTGAAEPGALWGECRGSAATPYRTVVDLSGPAYRCSCPSRKFPCKHALALLLLWAEGSVKDDAGEPPEWAASWLATRASKVGHGPAREQADPETAAKRAQQREERVASGLAELDRWLCDQVRQGLAASQRAGYGHWDDIAARMVDAQAPGLAERLRALASVPHSGAGWDGRLLEEYALLRLLSVAYRRPAELPPPLLATIRSRIGFSLADEPLLEAALDDRAEDVRGWAAYLLARLPGSALGQRMAERALGCLRLARGISGERLVARPPAECDAAMRRDGIRPGTGAGRSQLAGQADLLLNVIARTPLDTWTSEFGRSAEQILAVPAGGWASVLFTGWSRAAMAQRDQEWMAALINWAIDGELPGQPVAAETLRKLVRRVDPALVAPGPTASYLEVMLPTVRDAITVLRFRYDMLKELDYDPSAG